MIKFELCAHLHKIRFVRFGPEILLKFYYYVFQVVMNCERIRMPVKYL